MLANHLKSREACLFSFASEAKMSREAWLWKRIDADKCKLSAPALNQFVSN